MLFISAIEETTLDILKKMMGDIIFQKFYLVGGTALALQIGHRLSLDIDLFTGEPFNENEVIDHLRVEYQFETDFISGLTIKGEIRGVKVDCIAHQYPLISNLVIGENLRMAGLADIAAMKLNAISGDGSRLKDFIDIVYLSEKLTLMEMLEGYTLKYKSNPVIPLKAILYFEDINFNEPLKMAGGKPYSWKKIEKRLIEMQRYPERLFAPL
jgi:hypothetical protein